MIQPFDEDPGMRDTIIFHLDNNRLPDISILEIPRSPWESN